MRFTTPLALLLLLSLPYIFYIGRPTTAYRARRDWISLILRTLIILLLTMSLAGTQMVRAADELAVVFLLDGSDSISAAQSAEAETFIRESMATMGINDSAAVVVFGSNALVDRPMTSLAELASISSVPQTIQTDMAEALRLGLALFPAGNARRMVMLTDGAATTGDTDAAIKLAEASGVQLDVVTLSPRAAQAEAWLTDVDAPSKVTAGAFFDINVSAESSTSQSAQLRVLSGQSIIYDQTVELNAGLNNFAIRLRAVEPEFVRYTVELAPLNDTFVQNNQLAAFTDVIGPPRVLIVANDDTVGIEHTEALVNALTIAGLEIERTTADLLPSDLTALSNYASIVLVEVNAKNLSVRKMEALQAYVRDLGGGLVTIGGPETYGMGGYYKTALEEALPLDMQIKDTERFPAVSMVIVVDRSGSMGQQEGSLTKIQLAAEAAVRVAELLNPTDYMTVIPVDTQPSGQIGPMSIAERDDLIDDIRTIGAGGGGIYVRAGLEAAQQALNESPNEIKHVIVLADGSDSEQKEGVPELLDTFVAEGTTVTMVAIGNGFDVPWLEDMAVRGNGRFHLTNEAANLPQIFTQETTNIQRTYLVEERFFPTLRRSSPILNGIPSVPALNGYVGTTAKATAQVVLETHQGDPLLAKWQYGLGRSVAWTSDATGRWATNWVNWEAFPLFWTQAIRWTITEGRDNPVETSVVYADEQARLSVDVRDTGGALLNGLTLDANVVAPDGSTEAVTLSQVAPGRYETTFTPDQEGAYLVRVAGNSADSETTIGQTSGWVLGYPPEYQQFEPDTSVLTRMTTATGGRQLDLTDLDDVFEHSLEAGRAIRPIWPWLTLLAVILLPIDIAVRRLAITRRDWERAYDWSFGRFRTATPEPAPRNDQMSSLFEAKQRAEQRIEPTESVTPVTPPAVAPPSPAERPPAPQPKPTSPAAPAAEADAGSLAARLRKNRDKRNR